MKSVDIKPFPFKSPSFNLDENLDVNDLQMALEDEIKQSEQKDKASDNSKSE